MKKLAVVVFGNIAAGKTTFCNILQQHLKEFKYVCLDEYRKKNKALNLHPVQKEHLSENECLENLKGCNIIFETTGASFFWNRARVELYANEYNIFYIKIDTDVLTCLKRFNLRKSKGATPPFSKGKNILEILHNIEVNFKISKYNFEIKNGTINEETIKALLFLINQKNY